MARKSTRKTEEKELIKAAAIAIVRTKDTKKFLGFLVKSNSSQEYYQITCTCVAGECVFSCTCKSGQNHFTNCTPDEHGTRYCCHVKACILVIKARKALAAKAAQAQAEAVEVAHTTGQAPEQPAKATLLVAAPKFVNKTVRAVPKRAQKREETEEERKRLLAPLNGNGGFSLLMPVR